MEKIRKLKKIIKKNKIDGYIIPKNDEYFGEYISEYNDRLKHISNFSGSFGFSLIIQDKNFLFVDGRYTLQAAEQSGKYFKIKTIPDETPKDILKKKNLKIGFDPRLFTSKSLEYFFGKNKNNLIPINQNLVDKIWKRKKAKILDKFYTLPKKSIGESFQTKVSKIIKILKKKDADFQLITSSENNAWLLNIRGGDSKYSPIPHSYILIDKKKRINFFCDLKKITPSFKNKFKNIKFIKIDSINKILSRISNKKFIIDKNTCSIFLETNIKRNNRIIDKNDSIYFLKAVKAKIEIDNIKKAHLYDGVALTKYLFWLKKNFNKKKITEISAAKKLLNFRKKNKNFKFLSFPTISGTGPNAAIIHYKASKKSNRILRQGDIYLVDSGGQYNYGTTDVTRTISLHNSNKRIKNIFTRVLKGHIAVANYPLDKKTSGSLIDKKARKYLKQIKLDYAHGTGHGVGYFLNVHEGPHAISKSNKVKFQKGMIVSNEPGYYEKNKFGIRIENLIYVKNNHFEDLTLAPIDKNLININLLNSREISWLNKYHRKVQLRLQKFMKKKEVEDLKLACSAV